MKSLLLLSLSLSAFAQSQLIYADPHDLSEFFPEIAGCVKIVGELKRAGDSLSQEAVYEAEGYAQVRNGGATGGVNWNDGYVALALNFSDTAYDITPRPNGDGSFKTRLSQSEFNAVPPGVRAARLATAQANYLRSSAGALIAIHELIHNAVKPFGAGDGDLATAALSFTDQELVPSTSNDHASAVWDDRLAEACGGQRRNGIEKFIRKRGGVR